MTSELIDRLGAAQVYDLEQPRYFGMPVYPSHKPGYHYALHRRHRDAYKPDLNGQRSGSSAESGRSGRSRMESWGRGSASRGVSSMGAD